MTDKKISNGITTTDFRDDGDQLIVTQEQNITDILEANKADYNATDSRAGWGDTLNNRVARIPLAVFTDLEKKGITRGLTVIDMKRFKDWLNDPDNRVFRTRAGKI
jgi:hypothetical protein